MWRTQSLGHYPSQRFPTSSTTRPAANGSLVSWNAGPFPSHLGILLQRPVIILMLAWQPQFQRPLSSWLLALSAVPGGSLPAKNFTNLPTFFTSIVQQVPCRILWSRGTHTNYRDSTLTTFEQRGTSKPISTVSSLSMTLRSGCVYQ